MDVSDANRESSLDCNLQSLNYDNYIRQFVIGIQKYLHKEQVPDKRNTYKITR